MLGYGNFYQVSPFTNGADVFFRYTPEEVSMRMHMRERTEGGEKQGRWRPSDPATSK